jgi:hypothetical protein
MQIFDMVNELNFSLWRLDDGDGTFLVAKRLCQVVNTARQALLTEAQA